MYKIEITENNEVVYVEDIPATDDPFGVFEAHTRTLEKGETVTLFRVNEKTGEAKIQTSAEYGA